jgi:glycosyltransferase involved in cell wall biosynthesis
VRIAIVGPTHPYKGGIAQHTTLLAHHLRAAGHDVSIESWSRQYPERLYPGQQRLDEVEGEPFPFVRAELAWNRPDSWWRVGSRLGRTVDGVLIVQTTPIQLPAYLVLARSAARSGARVGVIAHNVLPHERRPWDEMLTRVFLGRVDGIVVHSVDEGEVAAGLGSHNIVVAALPFFFPHRGSPGNGERTDTLLFAGFVRDYKGLDDLFVALSQDPGGPRLLVVGEHWGDDAELHGRVRELGLVERVELRLRYVSVQELSDAFRQADALVSPYRSGTGSVFPRIAFQHGVPVVATTVGDLPAQVRDTVDGLLVPPNDPSALAGAIEQLYAEDTLARLRANVRPPDIAEEWNRYVVAVEQVLAGDVPGTRKGPC